MNNYRMLATARCGNTVVNELYEPNLKIISLVKTVSWSLLAITLKLSTSPTSTYVFRKKYPLNIFCGKYLIII